MSGSGTRGSSDRPWATFKMKMPREYYDELRQTIDIARRMGAHNDIEALSMLCAEFRTTWEAAENARPQSTEMDVVRTEAFERDHWRCLMCGARQNLTVHHITPLSQGGPRIDIDNLATLCWICHQGITDGDGKHNWKAARPKLLEKIGRG